MAREGKNGRAPYSLIDELMEQIPGIDGFRTIRDNAFDETIYRYNDAEQSVPLNHAYYHRNYRVKRAGVSGSDERRRGFSDENLFVAQTTSSKIAGLSMDTCNGQYLAGGGGNPFDIWMTFSHTTVGWLFCSFVIYLSYGAIYQLPNSGFYWILKFLCNVKFVFKKIEDSHLLNKVDLTHTPVSVGLWVSVEECLLVRRLKDIKHQNCSNYHKSMNVCVLIVFYC